MSETKEYCTKWPRCGAPPEKAKLKVISGRFVSDMPLAEDGFSPIDAKEWDTEDEIVKCAACGTFFQLYECLPCEQISHVETIEIRGLTEVNDGRLDATMHILNILMHVTFLRVRTNENHIQVVDGHPFAQNTYDRLCSMVPGGPFQTVQLAGRDGEWVMIITPFQR